MGNGRRRRLAEKNIPAEGLLEAGKVVSVHGVAGGIKVKALSGDPAGLLGAHVLILSGKPECNGPEGREYKVKAAHRSGGCAVFALEGVDAEESALQLVGARVFTPRGDLPALEDGEFFVADLVGCSVELAGGGAVGKVAEVIKGPAHDWLSIMREGGRGEALLPLVSEFILFVDTTARRIVASPPEGLLDED